MCVIKIIIGLFQLLSTAPGEMVPQQGEGGGGGGIIGIAHFGELG